MTKYLDSDDQWFLLDEPTEVIWTTIDKLRRFRLVQKGTEPNTEVTLEEFLEEVTDD